MILTRCEPDWRQGRKTTGGAQCAYHLQTDNKDNLLSLDFGLRKFGVENAGRRLAHYRDWVHDKGGISGKKSDMSATSEKIDRFRCRYFIDGGVLGSKEFVRGIYSHKLPMVDSIILATAKQYKATIRTQDIDFKDLPVVKYFQK